MHNIKKIDVAIVAIVFLIPKIRISTVISSATGDRTSINPIIFIVLSYSYLWTSLAIFVHTVRGFGRQLQPPL
jgi:hypothetical protein